MQASIRNNVRYTSRLNSFSSAVKQDQMHDAFYRWQNIMALCGCPHCDPDDNVKCCAIKTGIVYGNIEVLSDQELIDRRQRSSVCEFTCKYYFFEVVVKVLLYAKWGFISTFGDFEMDSTSSLLSPIAISLSCRMFIFKLQCCSIFFNIFGRNILEYWLFIWLSANLIVRT